MYIFIYVYIYIYIQCEHESESCTISLILAENVLIKLKSIWNYVEIKGNTVSDCPAIHSHSCIRSDVSYDNSGSH